MVLIVKSPFLSVLLTYVNHFVPQNFALWLDCVGISLWDWPICENGLLSLQTDPGGWEVRLASCLSNSLEIFNPAWSLDQSDLELMMSAQIWLVQHVTWMAEILVSRDCIQTQVVAILWGLADKMEERKSQLSLVCDRQILQFSVVRDRGSLASFLLLLFPCLAYRKAPLVFLAW